MDEIKAFQSLVEAGSSGPMGTDREQLVAPPAAPGAVFTERHLIPHVSALLDSCVQLPDVDDLLTGLRRGASGAAHPCL